VVERHIEVAELGRASEVFLAGTAAEVCAVRQIAGQSYTPGRITQTLMQDYDALVQKTPGEVASIVA
jgi:branched-chain amino acid aminotransferase